MPGRFCSLPVLGKIRLEVCPSVVVLRVLLLYNYYCIRYAIIVFHLLHVDELRLFGLLCLTVCDPTTEFVPLYDEVSARTLGVRCRWVL